MQFRIDNNVYNVIVEKKHNKNTYIRVKEDMDIYVTTNYLINNKEIINLLHKNINYLRKMINKQQLKLEQASKYFYLGQEYNIVIIPQINKVSINDNKLFIDDINNLDKWYKKEADKVFNDRLNYILTIYQEKIPTPKIRIRKMKTRWGVCNRKHNIITLNLELIKKDVIIIDYVIIHELSHFIYPNHSRFFWHLVAKYIPNYKKIRKIMKEI